MIEPVEHADPAGHGVQDAAASSLDWPEYVPALHGSCAEAPPAQ